MTKKELWRKYRQARARIITAKIDARDIFAELFKEGGEVAYRRKTHGNLLAGRILMVGDQRLRVENFASHKRYWVDSYWIEESR